MVKVTVECDGEKNVFEGDFVCGFVGTMDGNKGCAMLNILIGKVPSFDMPQYLADTAVSTIKNLPICKENVIAKYGFLAEFAGRAKELTGKEMAENADTLGEEIAKGLKRFVLGGH